MLPCIGIKRLTNHNKTPTTIRANTICVRGMLILPFCPCCQTFSPWFPRLLRASPPRTARLNASTPQLIGQFLQRGCGAMLSLEILDACAGRGIQAPGMDWPTKQSFCCSPILGVPKARVCSLVYNSANGFSVAVPCTFASHPACSDIIGTASKHPSIC